MGVTRAVVNHPGRLAAVIAANVAASSVTVGWLEGWQAADSAWWSVVTGTTTGYGDLAPDTSLGRLVAAWLMVSTQVMGWILAAVLAGRVIANEHLFSDAEQRQLMRDAELARVHADDAQAAATAAEDRAADVLDVVQRLERRLDTISADVADLSELARSTRLP